jgi:hypothetical protein
LISYHLSSRKYWRIDATITNFLDFYLSLALCAYPKSLRRRFISDPEVHLMGSELIGLLSF